MSNWKLPFVSLDLIENQIEINKNDSKNILIVSKKYFVSNSFSSKKVLIHTGNKILPVWISDSAILLNVKFGEFISTRKIGMIRRKK